MDEQTFSPWAIPNDPRISQRINDGPDCYCAACGRPLVWYACPVCDRPPSFEHMVRLTCGCPVDSGCDSYHSLYD